MSFDDLFPKRVSIARNSLGLTQSELAKRVGVVPRQIAAYEGGEAKPREKALANLSAALGATSEWLMTGTGRGPDVDLIRPTVTVTEIPVLTYTEALYLDEYEASSYTQFHRAPDGVSDEAFALTIKGSAMQSTDGISFPDGATITFDREIPPSDGDFVLAKLNETSEVTFKQVFFSGPMIKLHPLNPLFPDLVINRKDVNILATAVYVEYRLK